MRMSVDWNNLTFKGKDMLLAIIFVAGFATVYGSNNQKLNTIIDNQSENKALFREISIKQSKMELEILIIKEEAKSLKQRVDFWENSSAGNR